MQVDGRRRDSILYAEKMFSLLGWVGGGVGVWVGGGSAQVLGFCFCLPLRSAANELMALAAGEETQKARK